MANKMITKNLKNHFSNKQEITPINLTDILSKALRKNTKVQRLVKLADNLKSSKQLESN